MESQSTNEQHRPQNTSIFSRISSNTRWLCQSCSRKGTTSSECHTEQTQQRERTEGTEGIELQQFNRPEIFERGENEPTILAIADENVQPSSHHTEIGIESSSSSQQPKPFEHEKTLKTIYWAVARGHKTGIYKTWAECLPQIQGHPDALMRTFDNEMDAANFVDNPDSFDAISLEGGTQNGEREYFYNGVRAVYTDGSTKDGQTSIGIFWGDGDPRNIGEIIPEAEEGSGEVLAIVRAMEIGQNMRGLAIMTDSLTTLHVINEHLDRLEPDNDDWRNARGRRIKLIELYRRIKVLRQQFLENGFPVYFVKVDAHSNVYGNNQADRLARKARNVVSHYVAPKHGRISFL